MRESLRVKKKQWLTVIKRMGESHTRRNEILALESYV